MANDSGVILETIKVKQQLTAISSLYVSDYDNR